jgi:hypothetical protein
MKDKTNESPRRPGALWVAAFAILAGGCMSSSAETLSIATLATFAAPEDVRVEVRKECEPEVRLPLVMKEEIINRTAIQKPVLIEMPTNPPDGLAMTVTILGLDIPRGAGFSSEKRTLRILTVLHRNGSRVAEYDRFSEVQGSIGFIQAVFHIRKACDYVDYLVRDASKNTVERFKLMKLLPESASKPH